MIRPTVLRSARLAQTNRPVYRKFWGVSPKSKTSDIGSGCFGLISITKKSARSIKTSPGKIKRRRTVC
jgi:hypothetical protein